MLWRCEWQHFGRLCLPVAVREPAVHSSHMFSELLGTTDTQDTRDTCRSTNSLPQSFQIRCDGVVLLAAYECQSPLTSALMESFVAETSLRRPATLPASKTLIVSDRVSETPRPEFTTLKVTMYLQAPPGSAQQLSELHSQAVCM